MATVLEDPVLEQQNGGQLRRWLSIVTKLRVSMLPDKDFNSHDFEYAEGELHSRLGEGIVELLCSTANF
jgi:hypothetical protein